MKNTEHQPHEHVTEQNGSLLSYTFGFALSILLTLGAFFVAPLLGASAVSSIVIAALAQLFIQLIFFLHLGSKNAESGSNLGLFMLTAVIIGILVAGTLWIMSNLAHLHAHEPAPSDLYQNGVIAPQNELH